jgi:GAF domain-containing protein
LANRTQPALDLVVRSVAECAKADVASLVLKADNGEWVMRARAGEFRGYPVGYPMDTGGTLAGWIIRSAQAERIDDFGQEFGGENPFVAAIGAPILGLAGQVLGVVGVARMAGRPLFTEEDVEQPSNFTLQVGAALDLDRGRTDRETARLGAERDRIAADLRLIAVLDQGAAALGFAAEIEFAGPLRLGISDDLAEDIVAVVREGLSNVATHARAGHA